MLVDSSGWVWLWLDSALTFSAFGRWLWRFFLTVSWRRCWVKKKLQYQIYVKAFFFSFDAKCITILYFHFTRLALAMKLHFVLLHFKLLTTWECRNLSNNHCRIQNWLKTKWVITAVLHCTHNINIYTFSNEDTFVWQAKMTEDIVSFSEKSLSVIQANKSASGIRKIVPSLFISAHWQLFI